MTKIPRRAAVLVCALAAGCATPLPPGELEHIVLGSGRPVVVFQSGLGDGAGPWRAVQQAVAPMATTVAFSRPGYGRSPAGASDRSPCTIAAEQRAFLRDQGLQPPYLLVGHSLGGLYEYEYAMLYPAEVAGLVLLEPTHPRHWETLQREAPAMAALVRVVRHSPAFSSTMAREFDDQAHCLDTLEGRTLPPVPVHMLVREHFLPPESGDFERMMRGLWADWQRRSGAQVEAVPRSGHYLQRDQPERVSAAIRATLRPLQSDPAAQGQK